MALVVGLKERAGLGNFLILILATVAYLGLMRVATGQLGITKGNPYAPTVYLTLILTITGLALVAILDLRIDYLGLVSSRSISASILAVGYALVSFPIGIMIANLVIRKTRARSNPATVAAAPSSAVAVVSALAVVLLSAVAVIYVYVNLPVVPLLSVLSSPADAAQARILAARGFQGNLYIRNIVAMTFVPMASCVVYALNLHYKTRTLKVLFVISVACTCLALMYDLTKAPVLFYLLSLVLVRNRFEKFSAATAKRLRNFAVLGGAVLAVMYVVVMGVAWADLFDIWDVRSLAFRVMFGQVQPLLLHFEAFPDVIPFQMGRSAMGFLWSSPGEISARLVAEWANPWGVANGVAGVFNTFYIAEAWANFGWLGVLVTPLLYGFAWHMLYHVLSIKRTPTRTGVLGFVVVHSALVSQGSMIRLFYNPELVVSGILLWVCFQLGQVVAGTSHKTNEVSEYAHTISDR